MLEKWILNETMVNKISVTTFKELQCTKNAGKVVLKLKSNQRMINKISKTKCTSKRKKGSTIGAR